jgi:hypothetical protein
MKGNVMNLDLNNVTPLNAKSSGKYHDIDYALKCRAPLVFPDTLPSMPKHVREGYRKNGCDTLAVPYVDTREIHINEIDMENSDANNSARVQADPETISKLATSFLECGYMHDRPRMRVTLIPEKDLARIRAKTPPVPGQWEKKYWAVDGHNRYGGKRELIAKYPNALEHQYLLVDVYEHTNDAAVSRAASISNKENLPSCPDRIEDVNAKFKELVEAGIYTRTKDDFAAFYVEYGFSGKFSTYKYNMMKKDAISNIHKVGNDTIMGVDKKGKVSKPYSKAWYEQTYDLYSYHISNDFTLTDFYRHNMPQTGEIVLMIGFIEPLNVISNGGVDAERKSVVDKFNQSVRKYATTQYDWLVRSGAKLPNGIKDREAGIQRMIDNAPIKLVGFLPQRAKLGTHGTPTDMIEKDVVDALGNLVNLNKEASNTISKFIAND